MIRIPDFERIVYEVLDKYGLYSFNFCTYKKVCGYGAGSLDKVVIVCYWNKRAVAQYIFEPDKKKPEVYVFFPYNSDGEPDEHKVRVNHCFTMKKWLLKATKEERETISFLCAKRITFAHEENQGEAAIQAVLNFVDETLYGPQKVALTDALIDKYGSSGDAKAKQEETNDETKPDESGAT